MKQLGSLFIIILAWPTVAFCDDVSTSSSTISQSTTTVSISTGTSALSKLKPKDGNILWIFPNHGTQETPGEWKPMSSRDKLSLAMDDSFDPYSLPAIAVYASIDHWQNKFPVFGKSWSGFSKRYAIQVGNQTLDNFTSEAILPIVLHEDPRYFRLGTGGFWHRASYAFINEFTTLTDTGGTEFNYSGIGGHFISAGLENTYLPSADRNLRHTGTTIGINIGVDIIFNEAKEFWPDVRHWLSGR